jgi:hypothetical protein
LAKRSQAIRDKARAADSSDVTPQPQHFGEIAR